MAVAEAVVVAEVNTVDAVVVVSTAVVAVVERTAVVAVEATTVDPVKMRMASSWRLVRNPSPAVATTILEATEEIAEIIEVVAATVETAAASAETGMVSAEEAAEADLRLQATTEVPPKNNSPQLSEYELRLHERTR